MSIIENVKRLEKRIEKLAERPDVPLQPIEIRKATLDEVEDLVEPATRSRRVFPYTRVTVEVVASDAKRRAAMEAVLGERSDFGRAVTARLRSAGCPVPAGLEVRLRLLKRTGADWETGRVFRVQCERAEARPPKREAPATATATGSATLVVIAGEATRDRFPIAGERTNIGRLAEVLDRSHRVVRRNHVVFTESDNPVNLTVSRSHAHISPAQAGGYRLYDDGSSAGTRILRGGQTLALPAGSPRGTRLQPGDEIFFGQALVRFEVGPTPWPPK